MNVRQIIEEHLKANGYDGLWNEWRQCGCHDQYLMKLCHGSNTDCRGGYKRLVPKDYEYYTQYMQGEKPEVIVGQKGRENEKA